MAITDTATDTTIEKRAGTDAGATTGLALPAPTGVMGVIGSGDHKTIGRLWIGFSGTFGVASLALLAWYGADATSESERALQHFTLAVFGLVLGFVLPMFIGLATAVVPLQIGAATIAFPRAAAAALWAWLVSAVLLVVSYLPGVDGGVGGAKVDGTVLTYLALGGLAASLLLGTICVMTTIVTLRPAGMSLDRVPLFSWSMLVAGGIWLLTLPVLAVNALFVIVDIKYGAPSLFGARDQQWTQLSWIVLPPQVFAYAIPVLGVAADAVTTFARGGTSGADRGIRQPQRGALLGAIGAFGALSFGAYVQPAFDPFVFRQWAYIAQVAVIVLPLLATAGLFGLALRKGVTVTGPLACGLVGLVLLVLAALAGVAFVVGPLDLQSTNGNLMMTLAALKQPTAGPPVYTWGVFGAVVVAAAAGAVAGVALWSSKLTGRQLPAVLGKALAPLLLLAGLLVGTPFLVLGFANKADGLAEAARGIVIVAVVGAVLTLIAVLVAVGAVLAARAAVIRGAEGAGRDPWGTGATLEWATDSPPAPGNFATPPEVTSPEPLVDVADGGAS